MGDNIQIRSLHALGEREIEGLSEVLIDCVEGGASVSFMLPMSRKKAVRPIAQIPTTPFEPGASGPIPKSWVQYLQLNSSVGCSTHF
jgi:hypothetical protein